MRFKDKVALISAAANGIGRATATIMAREGATVIAVDNHQGRLDEAVPALRQAGGKASWSTRWTLPPSTGLSPKSSAITAASTSWSTPSAAAR
jgi:NAD(P)-dependent dehydrogenase (short-subunit alcohol dehydrogenase family)